ncbi:MAG: discoidin domain-containing protein, partial [Desulfobacterales bacterium]|nr:discoidin domain-containing protein [Desulfobacterales bacterium]
MNKRILLILSFYLICFVFQAPILSHAEVLPRENWTLHFVDSEEVNAKDLRAIHAFDGQTSTHWHTEWYLRDPLPPHEVQINLNDTYNIDGFRYLPRQDGNENGRIAQYEFYISSDGTNWGSPVASGVFPNNMIEQEVTFSQATGQFIRLVALNEVNGNPWTTISELNVLGTSSSSNQAPDGVINSPAGDVTIYVGDSVDFAGTGSDPDGNIPLTYLWNFGDPAIADYTADENP